MNPSTNEKTDLYYKNPTLNNFCSLDNTTKNLLKELASTTLTCEEKASKEQINFANTLLEHHRLGCIKMLNEMPSDIADIIHGYISLSEEDKINMLLGKPQEKEYNFLLEEQYDPRHKKYKKIPLKYFSNIITTNTKIIKNLPDKLKALELGWKYNKLLPKLPKGLETLSLSNNYNHPLDNLPEGLKKLSLSNNYNHPLDNLPKGLKQLKLGDDYKYSLDNLPEGLEKLDLGIFYDFPLNNLPKGLKKLSLSIDYNYELPILPESLKLLVIKGNYDYDLPTDMPDLIIKEKTEN